MLLDFPTRPWRRGGRRIISAGVIPAAMDMIGA